MITVDELIAMVSRYPGTMPVAVWGGYKAESLRDAFKVELYPDRTTDGELGLVLE